MKSSWFHTLREMLETTWFAGLILWVMPGMLVVLVTVTILDVLADHGKSLRFQRKFRDIIDCQSTFNVILIWVSAATWAVAGLCCFVVWRSVYM